MNFCFIFFPAFHFQFICPSSFHFFFFILNHFGKSVNLLLQQNNRFYFIATPNMAASFHWKPVSIGAVLRPVINDIHHINCTVYCLPYFSTFPTHTLTRAHTYSHQFFYLYVHVGVKVTEVCVKNCGLTWGALLQNVILWKYIGKIDINHWSTSSAWCIIPCQNEGDLIGRIDRVC